MANEFVIKNGFLSQGNSEVTGSFVNILTPTSLKIQSTLSSSILAGSLFTSGLGWNSIEVSGSQTAFRSDTDTTLLNGIIQGNVTIPAFGVSFPYKGNLATIVTGSDIVSVGTQQTDSTSIGGSPLISSIQNGVFSGSYGKNEYYVQINKNYTTDESSLNIQKRNNTGETIALNLNSNNDGFSIFSTLSQPTSSFLKLVSGSTNLIDFRYDANYIQRSTIIGSDTSTFPSARLLVKGAGTTSGTETLRITDSNNSPIIVAQDGGNVGIGTTPNSFFKLHLSGSNNLDFGGTTIGSNGTFSLQHGTSDNPSGNPQYTALGGIYFENTQSGYYQNDIVFKTTPPTTTPPFININDDLLWERFRISQNGITIKPDVPAGSYTSRLMFSDAKTSIDFNDATTEMQFYVYDPSHAAPIIQLTGFNNNINLNGPTNITSTGTTSTSWGLRVNNSNSSPILAVQDNKRVAINRTGNPYSYPYEGLAFWDLHVSGTVAANNYMVSDTIYINPQLSPFTSPGSPMAFKFTSSAAGYANVDFRIQEQPNLVYNAPSNNIPTIFTIKYDSKVGIGVDNTQPTAQLHIKSAGSGSATQALRVETSGSLEVFKILDDGSATQGFNNTASGDFSLAQGTSTQTGIVGAYMCLFSGPPPFPVTGSLFSLEAVYGDISTQSFAENDQLQIYDPSNNQRYSSRIVESYFDGTRTQVRVVDSGLYFIGGIIADVNLPLTGDAIIPADSAHSEGNDTRAYGALSHAEGNGTKAIGAASHAEGNTTQTIGSNSHAEGNNTIAFGDDSHAEGVDTISSGSSSHAEGNSTRAIGLYSHAEGGSAKSYGTFSHAEGNETTTGLPGAFLAEVSGTTVTLDSQYGNESSDYSVGDYLIIYIPADQNIYTQKIVESSFNGTNTEIIIDSSFSLSTAYVGALNRLTDGMGGTYWNGGYTIPGTWSHSEGYKALAGGAYSHAEGGGSITIGDASHAEGVTSISLGNGSHAEGYQTRALGTFSHAEGNNTNAFGNTSHTEGNNTIAYGEFSHAEGTSTKTGFGGAYEASPISNGIFILTSTYGDVSSNFGVNNDLYVYNLVQNKSSVLKITNSYYNFPNTIVEVSDTSYNSIVAYIVDPNFPSGDKTISSDYSHAEGYETITLGNYSHAEGTGTIANWYQHVQGQYNLPLSDPGAFIVGNGSDPSNRSNLIFASGSTVQVTGSLDVKGTITTNGTNIQALSIAYAIALG